MFSCRQSYGGDQNQLIQSQGSEEARIPGFQLTHQQLTLTQARTEALARSIEKARFGA